MQKWGAHQLGPLTVFTISGITGRRLVNQDSVEKLGDHSAADEARDDAP